MLHFFVCDCMAKAQGHTSDTYRGYNHLFCATVSTQEVSFKGGKVNKIMSDPFFGHLERCSFSQRRSVMWIY